MSFTTVKTISDRIIIFEGSSYTKIDGVSFSVEVKFDSLWVLHNSTIKTGYNDEQVAQGLLEGTLRVMYDGCYKIKLADRGINAEWIIDDER